MKTDRQIGDTRLNRYLRWFFGGTTALACVLASASPIEAQLDRRLFSHTTDPRVVSTQVQLALPAAQEGLALLSSNPDAESRRQAVASIDVSYRYLRAAQESADLIIRVSKFPDPLLPMQIDRMWNVRVHLLKCLDRREHVVGGNPDVIAVCTDNLVEGIRKLRILVGIMP